MAELNARLSYEEFEEWMAYYSLEPWGIHVEDQRWTQHYSLTWSAHNFRGEMPHFLDRDPEETARIAALQTVEDKMLTFFEMMASRPAPDPEEPPEE